MIVNRTLINKILAYSAIKIKANPPLLYSVLNPDTNSDSPSAKSKGVRFVSAKQDLNQINPKGIEIIKNQISFQIEHNCDCTPLSWFSNGT